jgi:hypothetical protein
MKMTFYTHPNKLRMIQDLVKICDGRFVINPLVLSERMAEVKISFGDVRNANKFSIFRLIKEQPYF